MSLRAVFLSLLFLIIPFFAWTQNLNTHSKKAESNFIEATKEFTLGNYISAEMQLIKALKFDANFAEAYFLMAEIKDEIGYTIDAIEFYKKGLCINSDFYPKGHYYLAKLYIKEGYYNEALKSFNKFLSFSNNILFFIEDAELQRENCLFAIEAIQNPVDFKLQNLGTNINSNKSEYFPTLTVDNRFLLFNQRLDRISKGEQEDFIGAELIDSIWQKSYPIDELNTPLMVIQMLTTRLKNEIAV